MIVSSGTARGVYPGTTQARTYWHRWAQAATAPSRLYKRYSTEGGIRVPCIARYPPLLRPRNSSNGYVNAFATAMDVMPTILELAGVQHPAALCAGRQKAPYRSRQVYNMTGKSWVRYFSSSGPLDEQGIYGDDFWFGWELHNMASLRKGKWKIVHLLEDSHTGGKGRWELFDLEQDPGETNDLAERMPLRVKELLALFDQYVICSHGQYV